ncbi:MAG: GH36 C-terminal domain-containing protein, partial [Abditibacteriota bacterium]|nr:GH36 C-terminal domain-containing protein [Abditibacteriota bacterium]
FAGAATGVWTFRTNHCIDGRPWNYRRLAECVRELRLIQECYAGDFYPLTEWSVSEKEWIAWQFDYPEKDKGLVQIFRREDSPFVSAEFALSGLDKDASYRLYDLDDGDMGTFTGKELMKGRLYTVAEKPAAKIIIYAKVK